MIAWAVEQFQQNQILQAAVLASPAAALTFMARNLPARLWRTVRARFTIELSFNSDMGDYHEIVAFVSERLVSERFSRRLSYHASTEWDQDSGKRVARHEGVRAGYGTHWGRYGRRPVIVERMAQEASATDKFKERMTVTFVTRGRAPVLRFVRELREALATGASEEMVSLFLNCGTWWQTGPRLPLRALGTVITCHGEAERLVEHVRRFEAERETYRRRGTPWHTGALLTGPPGTGKTSLIHAVASETGRSIRYLQLGAVESDRELMGLIAGAADWRRSLLVIEDADAAGAEVARAVSQDVSRGTPEGPSGAEAAPRRPVTLSTLLNVLDGLVTPDGLVAIATTNHPERLDPALRRPGRFDLVVELGPLDWAGFVRLAALFGHAVGPDDALAMHYRPESGAKLRALLIEGGLEAVAAHFQATALAAVA